MSGPEYIDEENKEQYYKYLKNIFFEEEEKSMKKFEISAI